MQIVEEDRILVIAIAHQHQRPGYCTIWSELVQI